MNISEMTPEHKSFLLSKAAGWELLYTRPGGPPYMAIFDGDNMIGREFRGLGYQINDAMYRSLVPNLYLPKNFHVAWLVLDWFSCNGPLSQWPPGKTISPNGEFRDWWREADLWEENDAQSLILDKILSLILEE